MQVSPFAGKPAEQSAPGNVPKLATAYCAECFRGADHLRRILQEAQTIVNGAIAPAAPLTTDRTET